MAESECKLNEKEPHKYPTEKSDQPSSSPLGVRRKLKKTFCRRRKSSKDTIKKGKAPWIFKFGVKSRECSAFEMSESNLNCDSCVCTVYRKTELNADSDNSNDSLCKNDKNDMDSISTDAPKDQFDSEKSAVLSDSEAKSSSSVKNEESNTLKENNEACDFVGNEDALEGSCHNNFLDDTLSAYHRCDRNPEGSQATVKSEDPPDNPQPEESNASLVGAYGTDFPVIDLTKFNPEDYPVEDWDERARLQRAKEMEEGVDPPPGYKPKQTDQPQEFQISELALYLQNHLLLNNSGTRNSDTVKLSKDVLAVLQELTLASMFQTSVHTQVDYIHCLVPDLLEITNCGCYWGKMDRYEAEKLLENKPEGTFLLRDSAQEEFLFSVSFQRYGKTLHARIEQWNHKFSFDSHDPGVFSSSTVIGLIEHYKDPSCCMYFDPMLTIPLHRTFPFSLQYLCRAVICNNVTYDGINGLQLPKSLKSCLKEYHYKQRVKVRRFDY